MSLSALSLFLDWCLHSKGTNLPNVSIHETLQSTFTSIILLVFFFNHSRSEAGQGFHSLLEGKKRCIGRYHLNGVSALYLEVYTSFLPSASPTPREPSPGTVRTAVWRDAPTHDWTVKPLTLLRATTSLRCPQCSGEASKSQFRLIPLTEAQIATLSCGESCHLISTDS